MLRELKYTGKEEKEQEKNWKKKQQRKENERMMNWLDCLK